MSANVDFISSKDSEACYFGPARVKTPVASNEAATMAYAASALSTVSCTTGTFVASMTAGSSITYTTNCFYVLQGDLAYLSFAAFEFTGQGASLVVNAIPSVVAPGLRKDFPILGYEGHEWADLKNISVAVGSSTIVFSNGAASTFTNAVEYNIIPFTVCYNKAWNP